MSHLAPLRGSAHPPVFGAKAKGFDANAARAGVDETAVEGTADTKYAISNFHVSAHHPSVNVPVLWWRSVGHTHNAFVMETLMDELAMRAKADPIAYRLKLLAPDAKKLRACLALLEEKTLRGATTFLVATRSESPAMRASKLASPVRLRSQSKTVGREFTERRSPSIRASL